MSKSAKFFIVAVGISLGGFLRGYAPVILDKPFEIVTFGFYILFALVFFIIGVALRKQENNR